MCYVDFSMIQDYLEKMIAKAKYRFIESDAIFYAEIPGLKGVWASGKALEKTRENLLEVLEGWVVLHLKRGLPIPGLKFSSPKKTKGRKVPIYA